MYNDYDDYDYGDEYGGHTGDPMLDREYERQRSVSDYMVSDPIKKFIVYFHEVIAQGNGFEISKLYEQTWPKLTEQYFKTSPWPEAEESKDLYRVTNFSSSCTKSYTTVIYMLEFKEGPLLSKDSNRI